MRLLIPLGSSSDMNLLAPIIRELGETKEMEVSPAKIIEGKFRDSYELITHWISAIKPDWALIVGDKIEMTGAAQACFHNNIKIAHYFVGNLDGPIITKEDINRHIISLLAKVRFHRNKRVSQQIAELFKQLG